MTLRKVTTGEPFRPTASTWNAFIDAAILAKQRGDARGLSISAGGETPNNTVLVKNNTGGDLSVLSVGGIDSPIISPTDNEGEFKVRSGWNIISPTNTHFGKLVVLAESIPAGEMGLAFVAGVVPVQVNRGNTVFDRADVNTASTATMSGHLAGTAQILWAEGTGTDAWCAVLLGQRQNVDVLGKANEDIQPNSTGAISVWRSGLDTGYDLEGVHLDWMHSSQQVSTGKEVIARYYPSENRWRIVHAECES